MRTIKRNLSGIIDLGQKISNSQLDDLAEEAMHSFNISIWRLSDQPKNQINFELEDSKRNDFQNVLSQIEACLK